MPKKVNIILSIIIICLFITNFLLVSNIKNNQKEIVKNIILRSPDAEFDNEKQYYININYKKIKKMLKNDNTYNIAVLDNNSNTYKKFTELINKISFYKNTKIYLLEIGKLSKKESIAFYEIDERLSKIKGNYIITIKKDTILSITEFNIEELNTLIEEME